MAVTALSSSLEKISLRRVPDGYRVSSVVFRLLFKLSLRDLVRMFLMRGYEFSHETVRQREERFASLLAEQLRRKRKEKAEIAATSRNIFLR